jgi:branched-chain amino acid transport system ATP-binding protein
MFLDDRQRDLEDLGFAQRARSDERRWCRHGGSVRSGQRRSTGDGGVLELYDIVGGYGSTTVLRGVSISVPAGSVVALLGPNGAGKSTTMRMASGLLRPSAGRVVFDGDDITRLGSTRRAQLGICHIIEGRSIFPSLTVQENLLLQTPKGVSR